MARWSFASHYDREEEGEDGVGGDEGLDAAPEGIQEMGLQPLSETPPLMKILNSLQMKNALKGLAW